MFLDINKIGREGYSFDRTLELEKLEGEGGEPIPVRNVRLQGRVEGGRRNKDLSGRLDAQVDLSCGRCVESFQVAIAAEFFLTLVHEEESIAAGDAEMREEDASFFHAPEGKVDLGLVAMEQIYLNLPLKPVCRDGCKGLCPACGGNRNMMMCGCRNEVTDPRLAPLLQWKQREPDA